MSAQQEIERLRNTNYREGKAVLEEKPEAARLLRRLMDECPHIDERELVALLRLEHEELIAATAHRLEYNATHGNGMERHERQQEATAAATPAQSAGGELGL